MIFSFFNWCKDKFFLILGIVSRKYFNFMLDLSISSLFSVDNSDYRGSGWFRGYMVFVGDNKFD